MQVGSQSLGSIVMPYSCHMGKESPDLVPGIPSYHFSFIYCLFIVHWCPLFYSPLVFCHAILLHSSAMCIWFANRGAALFSTLWCSLHTCRLSSTCCKSGAKKTRWQGEPARMQELMVCCCHNNYSDEH